MRLILKVFVAIFISCLTYVSSCTFISIYYLITFEYDGLFCNLLSSKERTAVLNSKLDKVTEWKKSWGIRKAK